MRCGTKSTVLIPCKNGVERSDNMRCHQADVLQTTHVGVFQSILNMNFPLGDYFLRKCSAIELWQRNSNTNAFYTKQILWILSPSSYIEMDKGGVFFAASINKRKGYTDHNNLNTHIM